MPQILAAITTFVLDLVVTVVVAIVLLIAMNGFSERDATPGLIVYAILAIAGSIAAGVGAWLLSGRFVDRGRGRAATFFISMPIMTVAGSIVIIAASLVAVAIAEYVRVHR